MVTNSDVRVAFIGDSFVAGVGDPSGLGWVSRVAAAAFAADLPLTHYNLGVRRDTSREVRQRWAAELRPRLLAGVDARIVVSFGVNDTTWELAGPRVAAAESVKNLEWLLGDAEASNRPVLVVGPPPVHEAAQQQRIAELSTRFSIVAERRGVPYVDIFAELLADRTWSAEAAASDGAHPGAGGYARLAELVRPIWLGWLGASAAA